MDWSYIPHVNFNNINIHDANLSLFGAILYVNTGLPTPLLRILMKSDKNYSAYTKETTFLKFGHSDNRERFTLAFFNTLKGLLIHGLKNNLFDIPEIKSWFDYEREVDREVFEGLIDGLEESVRV